MREDNTILELLKDAKCGDEKAQEKIYSLLYVRFLPLVSCKVVGVQSLKTCPDIENFCRVVCRNALSRFRRVCPITHRDWSLPRLITILYNVVDESIADRLVDMSKKGDSRAEEDLFVLLHRKVTEWFHMKRIGK